MDYSIYTTRPQKFSARESARIKKVKGALSRGAGGAEKRLRRGLRSTYKTGAKRVAPYTQPNYGPGSMSSQDVDRRVVSDVRSKYGNEIDAAPQRQAQISSYYDQWKQELDGIRTQQAQAQQQAIDETNNAQKTTSTAEQAGNQSLLQTMQADAAKRGASVDPSLFIKANQASAARGNASNTQAARMAATKNAADSYYAQEGLINRSAKQSTLDKERSYTSRLRSDAADYATGKRAEYDQSSFDRGVASKTLGIKQSSAQADMAAEQQRIAISQQQADASTQRANWATSPDNPDNQPDKPASKRDKSAVSEYRKARSLAKTAGLKKGKGRKYARYLVQKKGIKDDDLATAAAEEAIYGGANAALRKRIHDRYGFWVKGR